MNKMSNNRKEIGIEQRKRAARLCGASSSQGGSRGQAGRSSASAGARENIMVHYLTLSFHALQRTVGQRPRVRPTRCGETDEEARLLCRWVSCVMVVHALNTRVILGEGKAPG